MELSGRMSLVKEEILVLKNNSKKWPLILNISFQKLPVIPNLLNCEGRRDGEDRLWWAGDALTLAALLL